MEVFKQIDNGLIGSLILSPQDFPSRSAGIYSGAVDGAIIE